MHFLVGVRQDVFPKGMLLYVDNYIVRTVLFADILILRSNFFLATYVKKYESLFKSSSIRFYS